MNIKTREIHQLANSQIYKIEYNHKLINYAVSEVENFDNNPLIDSREPDKALMMTSKIC